MMENEIEEVEVEETQSISDQLSAAWDEAEDTDDADDNNGDSDTTRSEASLDSSGESGDADGDTVSEGVPEGEQPHKVEPVDSNSADVAPPSLSPAAREEWKNAPEAVRKEFKRLDERMEGLAQKFGKNAQRAEAMDRSIAPFAQYMQMNGGPGQSIKGLLETGSMLQMGSPQQKAQVVAQLISQFGVDIQSLDNLLVGSAPTQENQQTSQLQEMINQQIAPMQQQLGQYQQAEQQHQQQQQSQVGNEIQQFANDPANEFYGDVRGRMADELDLAAKSGQQLGLKEAYDLAVRANPDIFKIVSARESAKNLGSKRKAATSIHGTPQGSSAGSGQASIRSAIESAWDNAGQI
jgi:hypothetical protein